MSGNGRLLRGFIGSSVEQLSVARAIQTELEHDADTVIWNQGVFKASTLTMASLAKQRFDFGIFVLTPDDTATIREESHQVTRDNVLIEAGFFIAKVGVERTFLVLPVKAKGYHLASDFMGIQPVTY